MKTYLKLVSLLLALMLSLSAAAMTLNEAMSALGDAKASGLLGEKPDGYLGVVRSSQNSRTSPARSTRRAAPSTTASPSRTVSASVTWKPSLARRPSRRRPPGRSSS